MFCTRAQLRGSEILYSTCQGYQIFRFNFVKPATYLTNNDEMPTILHISILKLTLNEHETCFIASRLVPLL